MLARSTLTRKSSGRMTATSAAIMPAQGVAGGARREAVADELARVVAVELAPQVGGHQPAAQRLAAQGQRVGVGRPGVERQVRQQGLGAERPRQPVGLGPGPGQRPEDRAAEPARQPAPQRGLLQVVGVPRVAAEGLVAAVAREHHLDAAGSPAARPGRSGSPRSRRTARRSNGSARRAGDTASGVTISSVCRVPNRSATCRA